MGDNQFVIKPSINELKNRYILWLKVSTSTYIFVSQTVVWLTKTHGITQLIGLVTHGIVLTYWCKYNRMCEVVVVSYHEICIHHANIKQ